MTWSEWVLPSLACFWLISPYLPLIMFVWWVTKLHGNGLTYLPSLGLDRLEALTKNLGLATEAMQDGKLSQKKIWSRRGEVPPLPGNRYMGPTWGGNHRLLNKCRLNGRCLVPSFGGFFAGGVNVNDFDNGFCGYWYCSALCGFFVIYSHLASKIIIGEEVSCVPNRLCVYIYIYLFIYSIFTDLCYWNIYIYILFMGWSLFVQGLKGIFLNTSKRIGVICSMSASHQRVDPLQSLARARNNQLGVTWRFIRSTGGVEG